MRVLLSFPEIVESYGSYFEEFFSPEGYQHFKRLLSGFIVGSNTMPEGINKMFIHARNQSSLNRFVNRQHYFLP